jgi:predicted DNA-binding transcriptional regulator AlpA
MEYTFTLKYQLHERDAEPDPLIDRLALAGCDDALVGIGQPGRIALEFTRAAPSANAAMRSALEDVRRAIPGAHLIEASPDFVGLTDVAELVGVSRQNMRKLMLTHTDSFPLPVHEGSTAVWHLADVLDWLQARMGYMVNADLRQVARVTMQVNIARERRRITRARERELATLLE